MFYYHYTKNSGILISFLLLSQPWYDWQCISLPARQDASLSELFPSLFVYYIKTTDVISICASSMIQGKKKKKSTQVPWEYQQSCLNERGIYCLLLLLQADWYGKTVFAGVRLTCEKAILFWIILAEQPDLQETMTKMGPLISCHPLQYAFCGWIVRWSGVQRFTSENCSHIISVPALKKSPGELA